MKKFIYAISAVLLLAACKEGTGRVDQLDPDLAAPDPVTVTKVVPTPGGCKIWVSIPDDDKIKGVVATYNRNGQEISTKISRYVDSLAVEGFADTEEKIIKVSSFNVNETKSESVEVKFKPLAPSVKTVVPVLKEACGGVKIWISGNESKSDLAVCLLRDTDLSDYDKPMKDIKWVEVTTLFTASNNLNLTRRNLDTTRAIYGAYIRDRWGNMSDTVKCILSPIEEIKIPKPFSYPYYGATENPDNCWDYSSESGNYPIKGLWDDSGASKAGCFLAIGECPIPCWLTIDLQRTVELSRIATLPRIDYTIWANAHPRDFEFWGSMSCDGLRGEDLGDGRHGFDDSWVLLGKFTQFKPSGYDEFGMVGTVTQEDRTYFNSGNDFELDPDVYPHAYDQIRYLRIVFVNTFATFELSESTKAAGIQFGEVTPYGRIVK